MIPIHQANTYCTNALFAAKHPNSRTDTAGSFCSRDHLSVSKLDERPLLSNSPSFHDDDNSHVSVHLHLMTHVLAVSNTIPRPWFCRHPSPCRSPSHRYPSPHRTSNTPPNLQRRRPAVPAKQRQPRLNVAMIIRNDSWTRDHHRSWRHRGVHVVAGGAQPLLAPR